MGQWKKEVRRTNGVSDRQIRNRLAEFMWRERFKIKKEVFFNLWNEIADQYPVELFCWFSIFDEL